VTTPTFSRRFYLFTLVMGLAGVGFLTLLAQGATVWGIFAWLVLSLIMAPIYGLGSTPAIAIGAFCVAFLVIRLLFGVTNPNQSSAVLTVAALPAAFVTVCWSWLLYAWIFDRQLLAFPFGC
jgi:hypothetical protein